MTDTSILQIHREKGVEYLTLNRPDVRNALNQSLIAQLSAWAARVGNDQELRAVVLTGAGPVFCAGADISWMAEMVEYSQEENIRDATATARLFQSLDKLPVPLIVRIHGAALGGGLGLAAVADIVVAANDAKFGFTEVKLGLLPATIAPYVMAKIGRSASRELFLTGRRFTAKEAHQIGLVHAVVAADQLDATVAKYVEEILGGGHEAIAASKALIRRICECSPDEAMRLSIAAIADRRVSAEAQERMKAFLNKKR